MNHYPMSAEQRNDLDTSMGTITEMLQEIVGLLRACYDDQDSRTVRAEEVGAAMQRFRWALERQAFTEGSSNASARAADFASLEERFSVLRRAGASR
jgi:hypothetical protein